MIKRFDLWATERESANIAEHGLKWVADDTFLTLKIWHPKATKPAVHIRFRTAERRDAYLVEYVESFGQRLAAKAATKQADRARVAERQSEIGVGQIFRYSWGYDQTNVEYLQVVAKRGQMVTVREIAQSIVPGSEGFMCEQVKPRIGHFLPNAKPQTKRLQFTSEGKAYLSMPFGWCELFRGASSYQSHYA